MWIEKKIVSLISGVIKAKAKAKAKAEAEAEAIHDMNMQNTCRKCGYDISDRLYSCLSEQCQSNNSAECTCYRCFFSFQPDLKEFPVMSNNYFSKVYSSYSLSNKVEHYIPAYDLMLCLGDVSADNIPSMHQCKALYLTLPLSRTDEQRPFFTKSLGQYLQERIPPEKKKQSAAIHNMDPSLNRDKFEPAPMELLPEQLVNSPASRPANDAVKQTKPIGG